MSDTQKETLRLYREGLEKFGAVGLTELKEGLLESVGYDDIRLVRAYGIGNSAFIQI